MLGQRSWIAAAARRHLRSRRVLAWACVLLLAAGVAATRPLFDTLGFVFALAMAVLASVASADLGSAAVRRLRETPSPPLERALSPGRLCAELTARVTLVHLLLLVPPALLIALNGLRVQNCDWLFGIQAYLLVTGLSVVLATGIGVACGLFAGERRILANALPYLVILGATGWSLWRFYATPPVFSYNLFAGYFPGNLYDENVDLRAPFYWARLLHLSVVFALLSLVTFGLDVKTVRVSVRTRRPDGPRRGALFGAVGGGSLALILWLSSASLGFDYDASDLAARLPGRHETENFVIHYTPRADIARDIAFIAEDHEFRLAQVVRDLGVAPSSRITSFYFDGPERKQQLMGAGRVYMAKPWRSEIYLHHQPFPHPVLRHEIIHVVASEFGDPLFRVSAMGPLGLPIFFNVGLIEGLAVAIDWPDHSRRALTPHESVRALLELGMAPPIESLLSTGFLAYSAAQSYTVSGSFLRYLYDHHGGAGPLKILYRTGGDFGAAYGAPEAAFIASWRQMIESLELPEGTAEVVRERFRRPGIFERPCPHAIARMRDRVDALLSLGRAPEAARVMRRICAESPGEPRYRLELADILRRADGVDEAIAIYEEVAGDAERVSSTLRAHALLRIADQAAATGGWEKVIRILDQAAALPVEEDLARNIAARRFAALSRWPSGEAIRAYFWAGVEVAADASVLAGRAALAVAAEPDSGLAHYLIGRQLHGRGAPRDAARALGRAIDLGLPHPLLLRECARLLAEAAYLADDLTSVERAAALLAAEDQPEVVRLLGVDWLERVYWKRNGTLP